MVEKPNIKRIFVPDPGYLLVEADEQGADAQVVAWEADDQAMKHSLRTGVSLHNDTATKFYGDYYTYSKGDTKNPRTLKGRLYYDIKRATHATNYGVSARTLAVTLGWPISQAKHFITLWLHELHPGIGAWHDRAERELRLKGTATNAFGYSIRYFDRVDGLLPEALAWVPQSTVAIASFKGAVKLRKAFPFIQFLIQVHDSIVFQIPLSERSSLPEIKNALDIPVPYADPLIIPSKLSISETSWGDMAEWKGD